MPVLSPPAPANTPFPPVRLVADGVSLSRGERLLVSALSFELRSGQGLVVTGPNGAGKSTLLRALAGLLPPQAGTVRVEGAAEPEQPALVCHYVGHADGLKGGLTPVENLAFWARYLGAKGGLSPRAALTATGLDHLAELPVSVLSAGQKRRVALARLHVAPRPLWILDEPTTALDADAQTAFAKILQTHLERGGLAVAATHAALGLSTLHELRLG